MVTFKIKKSNYFTYKYNKVTNLRKLSLLHKIQRRLYDAQAILDKTS